MRQKHKLWSRLAAWVWGGEQPSNGAVHPEQIRREIDDLAMEHLGVHGEVALQMLRDGKLDGTAIEAALKMRIFLLGKDGREAARPSPRPVRRRATA